MKIYLTAACERAEELRGIRDVLTALGHEVTSRWIDWRGGPAQIDAEQLNHDAANYLAFTQYARADLADIDAADALIVFTGGGDGGDGGYHTAFGYALGKGKLAIMAGPREHVLHTLAAEWYPDWARLVMALSEPHPLSGLTGLPPVRLVPPSVDARDIAADLSAYRDDPADPGGGDDRYDPDEGIPWHGRDELDLPGSLADSTEENNPGTGTLRDYQDEVEHPHGYWGAGDYP
jgi:hypothetical protein